jgi:hypothetical protein
MSLSLVVRFGRLIFVNVVKPDSSLARARLRADRAREFRPIGAAPYPAAHPAAAS